ncbi:MULTISPECIES: DUF882 domain-containing protein [Rhodopseudomonas]|uniref:DUF882 domain-containing protein n=1 Tax=Rhodopseudomonas TaxID=1073 RepID=UPI000A9E6412
MRRFRSLSLRRAGYGLSLTSLLLLAGAGSVHDASALGETRTLSFHHTHSNEDLTVTFKRNGRYDDAALKQLNYFLRDWRSQDQTKMDPHLFDILWEVTRDVDAKKPIQIISAYRAPATNAMLRRRSSGVARHSQHMLGHAMDFFIPGVPLEKIRYAGLRLQRGGVGFYPTSGSPFVHLDTGGIRHWPRMTHDQLVRVFPDGRTVHVPSDGKPLPGYQLALADIEKRGNGDSASSPGKFNLFAALFKSRASDDDEDTTAPAAERASPAGLIASLRTAVAKSTDPKLTQTAAASIVPLPRAKPAAAVVQLASADEARLPAARPQQLASASRPNSKPQTPADIINARGFWDDMPLTPKQASPAQIAALRARQAIAAADPQSTASIDAAFQAMAYAPEETSSARYPNVVTASVPMPHRIRPASLARDPMAVTHITTVIAKGESDTLGTVATSRRLTAAGSRDSDVWIRAMILTPSASKSMYSTVLGDVDLTAMSSYFVKPQTAVAMSFSDDPQPGLFMDKFTGPAVTPLPTTPFVGRTVALR